MNAHKYEKGKPEQHTVIAALRISNPVEKKNKCFALI